MTADVESAEIKVDNVTKMIALTKRYTRIDELTAEHILENQITARIGAI